MVDNGRQKCSQLHIQGEFQDNYYTFGSHFVMAIMQV